MILDHDDPIKFAQIGIVVQPGGGFHPEAQGLGPQGPKDKSHAEADERAQTEKGITVFPEERNKMIKLILQ